MPNILFVGATRNFFKVGHRTIHHLSKNDNKNNISLTLAVPDPEGAVEACKGANVKIVGWEPKCLDPISSLTQVFQGSDSILLVPPIYQRIKISEAYIQASKNASVKRIVCIAIQHVNNPKIKLSQEAFVVQQMMENSGLESITLHLPMFLENLLYQANNIKRNKKFTFPCKPKSRFSFVACDDLAPIVGQLLSFENENNFSSSYLLSAQETSSCEELAQIFSNVLGEKITFETSNDEEYCESLMQDTGSASEKDAALGVLQLWKEIDQNRDMVPNDTLTKMLKRNPMTINEWVIKHSCCFKEGSSCTKHPQPPSK